MSITALGTDMPDTPEAFLISMEDSFYLLSCPEGTQRHCSERGYHFARPSRLKLVILPDSLPSNIMGFPGIYMAMADSVEGSNSSVTILTRNNESCVLLENWWQQCEVAFRSRKILVNFQHTQWNDEHCQMRFHPQGWLEVTFSSKSGRFLPEEAIRLGVNKQNFGKLHKGACVRSDREPWNVIYPSQVVSPPQATRRLLYSPYIEIKEADFLRFDPHFIITTRENVNLLETVKTITGSSADVWLVNPDSRISSFLGASCLQDLLHSSDPQSFPRHRQNGAPLGPEMCESSQINFYHSSPGNIYKLYHTKKNNPGTNFDKCKSDENIRKEVSKSKHTKRDGVIPLKSSTKTFVYVLGSGCATPSVFRNVSCYMVSSRSDSSRNLYVIDCGEGSLGQLSRIEDLPKFLLNFDAVVVAITHGHADHHFGTWSFLRYLYCVRPELWAQKAVTIYIPEILKSYAQWMMQIILPESLIRLVDEIVNCLPLSGGILENGLTCVPVVHSAEPYGYILTLGKIKIVFSGDTRPSAELITAGQNAKLLIHEATFLDADFQDAENKMHSTFTEALCVQKAMRAESCLLTHFSQKYIKRTRELIASANGSSGAACAIDFLRVDICAGLPSILFSNEVAEAIEIVQREIKLPKCAQ